MPQAVYTILAISLPNYRQLKTTLVHIAVRDALWRRDDFWPQPSGKRRGVIRHVGVRSVHMEGSSNGCDWIRYLEKATVDS